ncbi:MAG: helix-turn-helix domain-containing protein [Solirubrobacterales bacterium]
MTSPQQPLPAVAPEQVDAEQIDAEQIDTANVPLGGVDRPLTAREQQILALSAAGLSCKEIGRRLEISPRTVDAHRYRILRKLGVRSIAHLRRLIAGTPNATAVTGDCPA